MAALDPTSLPAGFLQVALHLGGALDSLREEPTLVSLHLGGAEPAILEHFKEYGLTIAQAPLHTIFRFVAWPGSDAEIVIQRSPSTAKLSLAPCSPVRKAFLKARLEGKRYDLGFPTRDLDEIARLNDRSDDRAALCLAEQLLSQVLSLPLSKLA